MHSKQRMINSECDKTSLHYSFVYYFYFYIATVCRIKYQLVIFLAHLFSVNQNCKGKKRVAEKH
jgi:hypothetical protein